jgi:hypothetical protein
MEGNITKEMTDKGRKVSEGTENLPELGLLNTATAGALNNTQFVGSKSS